jgi:tetratricopeptide (TPR) repeat protein
VVAVMVLRQFGIGPAASLLAAGRMHGSERIIVADFAAGADSSLSHVVTEAVRTDLGESRAVSVVAPATIAATLQRMQRAPSSTLDAALAREVAQRAGVKAIVTGDVTPLGQGFVVSLRLVTADSANELAAFRATADGPSQLLATIDELTRKLRGRIGESLRAVRDAPPLDQVTTTSLDALRRYAEAVRVSDLQGDYQHALQFLREAVALDTTFAMAYRKEGVELALLGMPAEQVDSAVTRAWRYRDRLPPRERYVTEGTYWSVFPHADRRKAAEAYQAVLDIDSTDDIAANNLAGVLRSLRRFAQAESLYRAINLMHPSTTGLGVYGGLLLREGKVAEADSVYGEMARRIPNAPGSRVYPATMMYARGQPDSAEAFWRTLRDDADPLIRITSISSLAGFALLHGRVAEAKRLSHQALAMNAARGVPTNPLADALTNADIAIWFYDRPDAAVNALDAALARAPLRILPPAQRAYYGIAIYYAWAGRPDRARAIVDQARTELDARTFASFSDQRHEAMGWILEAEGKAADGIRELWASDSLPDGPSSDCTHCVDIDLALAYDHANLPDSAIKYMRAYLGATFERSPPVDAEFLAPMLSRLAAREEERGDLAAAAEHYAQFIALWKDADSELQPRVAEARRRLAIIQPKLSR